MSDLSEQLVVNIGLIDKDREKATEALDFLEENAEFEEDSDDDYWWENMF